ncbi:hypothetical protein LPJ54_002018 [Coemansia sp. RSA 1824]|nr:hypothetical protein LPJ54_002018 [Coemansia sp. RSA 1824]
MDFYSGHSSAESPAPLLQTDTPNIDHGGDTPDEATDGYLGLHSKRQRISRACDRCRHKKVKCDGRRPICTHCEAVGGSCTYLDATKKRGPPKGYIDAIENRLHAAEDLIKRLVLSNSATARLVLDTLHAPDSCDPAMLRDSAGKLFGCMSMAELETRAAGHIVSSAAGPARQNNTILATTSDTAKSGFDDSHDRLSYLPRASPTDEEHNDTNRDAYNNANEVDNVTHLEKGVGHLTLDSTGSLRYLGDSSGWYIINRSLLTSEASPRLTKGVDGAFRWPPISTIQPRDTESGSTADPQLPTRQSYSVPTSTTGGEQPRSAAPRGENPCDVPIPRNLPPCGKPPMPDIDEQIKMLSLYFRYVHPVFPILYKSHFLGRMFDKEKRPLPALTSAVFAAASTYKAREAKSTDDLARVRIEMAVHFQRAKMYLDEQYTHNSIASIQTLLLMSVYEQGTMSTRSWLYSGMAIRKAYDLGLHRDVGAPKHKGLSVLSQTEAEIRQRAWWGCYVMDIMVSATLGRPTTIRDFTFDAAYPANYGEDDDELLVNSSMTGDPLEGYFQFSAQDPSAQEAGPVYVTSRTGAQQPRVAMAVAERMRDYVALSVGESESDESDIDTNKEESRRHRQAKKPLGVYYLDLLHILGHILTEMYTCKPHRSYITKYCLHDLHSRTDRLITLDHQLREWKMSLPSQLLYPTDDILAARPARCVYIALIHLVYYTAMILLHRPFISRIGSPHPPPASDDAMDLNDSNANAGLNQSVDSDLNCPGASYSMGGTGSQAAQSSTPSSPLPSHSICTVSAQMISLIGQAIIQDSRIFIMPFLTFMMFTAGTMHLNNVIVAADSWIARRFLKRTLNVMSRLGAHWQVSYKCYTMLNTLVRANRIGLDQVIDDNETGIRIIKERNREISRIAQDVYESRILHHGRPPSTRSNRARSHSPHSQYEAPGTDTRTADMQSTDMDGIERSSRITTMPATAFSIPATDPQLHSSIWAQRLPSHSDAQVLQASHSFAAASSENRGSTGGNGAYLWTGRDISRTAASHTQTIARPDETLNQPARSTIASSIFLLRDKLDANGRPIVPASPYTSVNFSAPDQPQTRPYEPSSFVFSNDTAASVLPGSGSALGQFVPSLEFFANADFPLGIGGPNGQAPAMLPQAMGMQGSNRLFADMSTSGILFSPTLASTQPPQPEVAAAVSAAHLSESTAAPSPMSNPMHFGSTDGLAGIGSNITRMSGQLLGDTAGTAASELTPARMGFSGVLIDDDVIRNLPFSGPVSYDLGFGGINGLPESSREAEMSVQPQSTHAVSSSQQQPMPAGAGGTPWSDYVSQLIRMFNDNSRASAEDRNQHCYI